MNIKRLTTYLCGEALDAVPTELQKLQVDLAKHREECTAEKRKCPYEAKVEKEIKALEKTDNANIIGDGHQTGAQKPARNGRQQKMYDLISKKRPEIVDVDGVIAEIDKFQESKARKAALHWFIRGSVRLPEDAYKVESALKVAEKAKVDPMSYDSPMNLIGENSRHVKGDEIYIDPDTVPELSNKTDMGYGITVYDVQDDEEGQAAMRKILNSHYGKDADGNYFSPWCLLHDDGHGGLSSNAWSYWDETYNALPKKAAFRDGKVIAFMATDGNNVDIDRYLDGMSEEEAEEEFYWIADEEFKWVKEDPDWRDRVGFKAYLKAHHKDAIMEQAREAGLCDEEWWDLSDSSHPGIPVGNLPVPNDKFGRWADFEMVNGNLVMCGDKYYKGREHVERTSRGRKTDDEYIEWYDDGGMKVYRKGNTDKAWFKNGVLSYANVGGVGDIGVSQIKFHEDGTVSRCIVHDDMPIDVVYSEFGPEFKTCERYSYDDSSDEWGRDIVRIKSETGKSQENKFHFANGKMDIADVTLKGISRLSPGAIWHDHSERVSYYYDGNGDFSYAEIGLDGYSKTEYAASDIDSIQDPLIRQIARKGYDIGKLGKKIYSKVENFRNVIQPKLQEDLGVFENYKGGEKEQ